MPAVNAISNRLNTARSRLPVCSGRTKLTVQGGGVRRFAGSVLTRVPRRGSCVLRRASSRWCGWVESGSRLGSGLLQRARSGVPVPLEPPRRERRVAVRRMVRRRSRFRCFRRPGCRAVQRRSDLCGVPCARRGALQLASRRGGVGEDRSRRDGGRRGLLYGRHSSRRHAEIAPPRRGQRRGRPRHAARCAAATSPSPSIS